MDKGELLTSITGRFRDPCAEERFSAARRASPWEHRFNSGLVGGICVALVIFRLTAAVNDADRAASLVATAVYLALAVVVAYLVARRSCRIHGRYAIGAFWAGHALLVTFTVVRGNALLYQY